MPRSDGETFFVGHVAMLGMMCFDYVQLEISYETWGYLHTNL